MAGQELMEFVEKLSNLPDKETKVYLAVGQFIGEGRDISTLTISEISSRAGIGKGTTYEYFKSKEELLSRAIYYLMVYAAKDILMIMVSEGSFKEKFYSILDDIWRRRIDEATLQSIVKTIKEISKPDFSDKNLSHFGLKSKDCKFVTIESTLRDFVNQGIKEGIFTEKDATYQKNIFYSQFILFLFMMKNCRSDEEFEEIKDFIYKGLVALLNLR